MPGILSFLIVITETRKVHTSSSSHLRRGRGLSSCWLRLESASVGPFLVVSLFRIGEEEGAFKYLLMDLYTFNCL
jgi:hypothetical protein